MPHLRRYSLPSLSGAWPPIYLQVWLSAAHNFLAMVARQASHSYISIKEKDVQSFLSIAAKQKGNLLSFKADVNGLESLYRHGYTVMTIFLWPGGHREKKDQALSASSFILNGPNLYVYFQIFNPPFACTSRLSNQDKESTVCWPGNMSSILQPPPPEKRIVNQNV